MTYKGSYSTHAGKDRPLDGSGEMSWSPPEAFDAPAPQAGDLRLDPLAGDGKIEMPLPGEDINAPSLDMAKGGRLNIVVDTARQGVVLLIGDGSVVFCYDKFRENGIPHLTPVQRAVVVARLRALADLISDPQRST